METDFNTVTLTQSDTKLRASLQLHALFSTLVGVITLIWRKPIASNSNLHPQELLWGIGFLFILIGAFLFHIASKDPLSRNWIYSVGVTSVVVAVVLAIILGLDVPHLSQYGIYSMAAITAIIGVFGLAHLILLRK